MTDITFVETYLVATVLWYLYVNAMYKQGRMEAAR